MASDHKATYSAAVPSVWQTVRAALEANPSAYKGRFVLKQITCGGSAPSNEVGALRVPVCMYMHGYSTPPPLRPPPRHMLAGTHYLLITQTYILGMTHPPPTPACRPPALVPR